MGQQRTVETVLFNIQLFLLSNLLLMKANRFEDLEIRKKSRILTNKVFPLFNECKNYWFKDQIIRTTLSIMNNVAEWFDRKTRNYCLHFLTIAKGSGGEVKSMLYIAIDQNYISQSDYEELMWLIIEIQSMMFSFSKKLKEGKVSGNSS